MRNAFFLLIVGLSVATSCDGAPDQDRQFIQKVKSSLAANGHAAKVSEIHPGNWEKVCIHPANDYHELKGPADIRNRSRASTRSDDSQWGIYFVYADNTAEYYQIPTREMTGFVGIARPEGEVKPLTAEEAKSPTIARQMESRKYETGRACIDKPDAMFVVQDESTLRDQGPERGDTGRNGLSKNVIELRLTTTMGE